MIRKIYLSILSICFCLSVITLYSVVNNKATVAVFADEISKLNIIIDCGHGGEDGGAVSENGILEKDINLDIGLILEQFFIQGGFNVQMIRRTDTAIYDETANNLKDKKISDIHNRSDICNSSPDNIYISIHQNKFTESKYYGTQVFYSKNDDRSKALAEFIRLSVKELIQNDNERQCKEATKDIYILNNASVPAVLVECGFLSNPEEERLLNTELYRERIAYGIFCGFLEFYNNYYR